MGLLLLLLLFLLLIGTAPFYPYSHEWGYYPSGLFMLLLIVVLVLALTRAIPWGWRSGPPPV
jgi:hypothetical protein